MRVSDDGDGAPLLLLHALGASRESWLLNTPALSPHFRCIAPDLAGFGDSGMPPRFFSIGDYAESALSLLDRLQVAKASVAGVSMGALIAIEMAARSPGRVDRLVLMAAPGAADEESLDCAMGKLLRWVREDGVPRMLTLDDARLVSTKVTPELLLLANLNLARARAYLPALAAAAAYAVRKRAALVRHRTLLLWGREDQLVGPEQAQAWLDVLDDARLEVLEGAGHSVPFDASEEVNRFMLDFLRT